MGSRVFWAIVVGFLCGVFARSFLPLGISIASFFILLGAALLCMSIVERNRESLVVAIVLVAFAGGIFRTGLAILPGDPALSAQLAKSVTLEGVIATEPDVRTNSTLVTITADELMERETSTPVHAHVLAYLPAGANTSYGERVRLTGTLEYPQAFATGEGRSFAYPEYLGKDGIAYILDRAKVQRIADPKLSFFGTPNTIIASIIVLKHSYVRGLQSVLPQPEAGLAGGITVGDKRAVGSLDTVFQRDSLVHMVVLSGYNITVVINAVLYLLAFGGRALQFSGGAAVALFFVLLSGGAASAVRSALMALLALYARGSGRIFLATRAIGATAFAMVLWNPWTLCFDPSFQLSALATLGLILFTEPIAKLLPLSDRYGAREIAASTVATQLAVLPLLLYQSGLLSLVSLPANLLALFPVPLAMFFSLIAGLLGALFGPAAAPLALPAYALLAYIISIARLLSSLSFAAVSVPAFPAWVLFAAYGSIFALFAIYKTKTTASGAVVSK